MRSAIATLLCLSLVGTAAAVDIPLLNGDFEQSELGYTAPAPEWNGGADFNHADTGISAPAELGLQFGFLGSGAEWGIWQTTSVNLEEGFTYTLEAWLLVRNNGNVPLAIGYLDDTDTPQVLATAEYGPTYTEWTQVPGVSYTPAGGSEGLGRPLVVGIAGNDFGLAEGDAWFDNLSASYIPEPASLVLLALGALALRRR